MKRDSVIKVRVNPRERRRIEFLAKMLANGNVSQLIRDHVLRSPVGVQSKRKVSSG